MVDKVNNVDNADKIAQSEQPKVKPKSTFAVAPGPHISLRSISTRRTMADVLIALTPAMIWSIYTFRQYAAISLAICVGSCLLAEALFQAARKKSVSLGDLSAVVTGVIISLSLPVIAGSSEGWYVGVVCGFVAIGLGKVIFGSLGQNIFNPAMVGRAFVMFAFPALLGAAGGYVIESSSIEIVTQATPLATFKTSAPVASITDLAFGFTNGSTGEIHAIACLLGGLYLCVRRVASWEIPLSMLLAASAIAGIAQLTGAQNDVTVLHHILGGAMLFGAFFIATDPVTSPMTSKGKFIFGAGVGILVMILRLWSSYPEGVMFSVLLMNAIVPLINRYTIPKPLGGILAPAKKGDSA